MLLSSLGGCGAGVGGILLVGRLAAADRRLDAVGGRVEAAPASLPRGAHCWATGPALPSSLVSLLPDGCWQNMQHRRQGRHKTRPGDQVTVKALGTSKLKVGEGVAEKIATAAVLAFLGQAKPSKVGIFAWGVLDAGGR